MYNATRGPAVLRFSMLRFVLPGNVYQSTQEYVPSYRNHLHALLCVAIPSILIASLHLSIYVGTSAAITQIKGKQRRFFLSRSVSSTPPSEVLALFTVARGVQHSFFLVDGEVALLW